jgi:hypothetical protein
MPKVVIDGEEYEVVAKPPATAPKAVTIGGEQYQVVPPEADEPSFEGGLVRAAGQGLSFGFGDEIEAGVKALAGGDYREELGRARRKQERFREKHPYLSTGAEILGGVALPIGAGANLARQGLTAANVAKGALRVGAPTGALFGLGEAENISSPEEAIAPAAKGALAGAAGYAVAAPVAAGLARGGRAVYDSIRDAADPRGAAARKVAESFQAADIPLPAIRQEMQRGVQGTPSTIADVAQDVAEQAGRTGAARPVMDLGRSAVAVAREGEQATERLMQRQVDQPGRVTGQLRAAAGGDDFEGEFKRLEGVIGKQAKAAYQRAHAGNPQVDISATLKSINRLARTRAGDIRSGMQSATALFKDKRRAVGTLRKYIDARQALDQMIEGAKGAHGKATPLSRELSGIRRRLNDAVRSQNKDLAQADDLFSGARGAQQLLERGRQLVTRAGERSTRELRDLARMTPEQRRMIRLGFLQRMADDVENKRLGNETVGQFRTPAGQRLIREVVGGQDAERLIAILRREGISTKTLREWYSGSRTAPLQEDMKALQEGGQLAADAMTGNVRGVMTQLAARLRRQIGARQAREILDMMSETDAPRVMAILDELEAGGAALARRQGGVGLFGLGGGAAAAGQAGGASAR